MRTKRPATYKDVLAAPENKVAELIDGTLYLSARPAGPHALVASLLGIELGSRFGGGARSGWWILDEPELHLGKRVVVPDLAGWKKRRMPTVPMDHKFTTVPDWICEIESPSTSSHDRIKKRPLYAAAGVKQFWWIEPLPRLVEVYRAEADGWKLVGTYGGNTKVRMEPFATGVLDLSRLWAGIPRRASEPYQAYAP